MRMQEGNTKNPLQTGGGRALCIDLRVEEMCMNVNMGAQCLMLCVFAGVPGSAHGSRVPRKHPGIPKGLQCT